jgi:alpha-beta hydrolase superfamily lysophospholipase
MFPYLAARRKDPLPYMESIHADYHGEWAFDLRWRPINSFPNYAGWVRAMLRAHQWVRSGLAITCPVLVMHSDKSVYGAHWHPGFQTGDGVLNVAHIREGSRHLGANVQIVEIRDGMHDLVLSRSDVRAQVFAELFSWLARLAPPEL